MLKHQHTADEKHPPGILDVVVQADECKGYDEQTSQTILSHGETFAKSFRSSYIARVMALSYDRLDRLPFMVRLISAPC